MATELRNVATLTLHEIGSLRLRYARDSRVPSSLKQAWIRPFVKVFCGERGIRTPETLLEFTRFPGVPLQPLEHLSFSVGN